MDINKNITINDVLSHYNVIGMAIAVAIGIAGQQLFFSLADDIIIPGVTFLIYKTSGRRIQKEKKFEPEKFVSALLTFLIVTGVVIAVLYTVLKPLVKDEIINSRKESARMKKLATDLDKLVGKQQSNVNKLQDIEAQLTPFV